MQKNSIVFITKDACPCNLLPTYGNRFFKTPNISALADKGTVFTRHYTAAPSTWMSNIAMFSGMFMHESELETPWGISRKVFPGKTLFDRAHENGFECHVFWDESWDSSFRIRQKYIDYDRSVVVHSAHVKQAIGSHYIRNGEYIVRDANKTESALKSIDDCLRTISNSEKTVFLWIHLPHLLDGFTAWGEDIEAFDDVVGMLRNYFQDECIYISADHGAMCGTKHAYGYGYHVYEPNIRIPLIIPRHGDVSRIDYPTSNVDIYSIIFEKRIEHRKFVYSDTQLCAQPVRKLAIILDNYKYIYNKRTGVEELYDLSFDFAEDRNLISDMYYDNDRCVSSPLREMYYYPYWDQVEKMRTVFRNEKNRIWKRGKWYLELGHGIKFFADMHGLKRWRRKARKRPIIK